MTTLTLLLITATLAQAQQQPFFNNNFQTGQNVFPNNNNNINNNNQLTQGQTSFLDLFGSTNQSPRIYHGDLVDVDWTQIDRRAEENWNHLYPFGERFYDIDASQFHRSWHDQQIDLDFFLPYYGFRYNYTFIFPEGFIAFSFPWYIQPPYTFPNPRWPIEADPSLIATFMSPQSFMFVGEVGISHVWYRVIYRPTTLIGQRMSQDAKGNQDWLRQMGVRHEPLYKRPDGKPSRSSWGREYLKIQDGRVEDPAILDQITEDLQQGMVGARGFVADYALIVTWERMGYGGAPKSTQLNQYEQFKKYQNTYQMVIVTDEIRSFSMFNYANINWTASTSAGALIGRGGRQSAMVGFNGGNGTGFFQMPYSADGNSYKLVQYGSTQVAGRWQARIDEVIEYGGCSNASVGQLMTHIQYATMLGGFALNMTGPCFRDSDVIKFQIDELTLDCQRLDIVMVRCVIPVNNIFRQGIVDIKLSVDGGKEYSWWNKFYLLSPNRGRREINLIDDPLVGDNNWRVPAAQNLTLSWPALNLSMESTAAVDITLWGYWEDVETHDLTEIGSIIRKGPNTGRYYFNPKTLARTDVMENAWKKYNFGCIQVRISDSWVSAHGDGIYWSHLIPFGWYFKDTWEQQLGSRWALEKCVEWFEYDGRRENFYMYLEPKYSCPCTLNQAVLDIGRFFPQFDCDMAGDGFCYYTQGASHCVISVNAIWTGAGQQCCYDPGGWLMFSQDWEYNKDYLRFYSAGVPHRAHMFGAYPFKRPPYVPAMSNFYNDYMPFEFCCKWAGHCELYYWRRETSGCQQYRPSIAGFAYGEPHFITFDGARYSFNGKGYFVLAMMKTNYHDLMVQVRMEEPPKTLWAENVMATVITGVAMQDNGSDVVQVYARKEFRDWRYKMDIYIGGYQVFFDKPWKKTQYFGGVVLFNPARNMNASEIHVLFGTGVGIRVMENRGILDIMVVIPPDYNETLASPYNLPHGTFPPPDGVSKCAAYDRTMGLLGTCNNKPEDDFTTPDCTEIHPPIYPQNMQEASRIYYEFGLKWRVDPTKYPLLFHESFRPINNPLRFAETQKTFVPIFDPWAKPIGNESLIFRREEVQVLCQGIPSCEYDYLMTGRREIALDTLNIEKKNELMKANGQILISCGPLQKNQGVVKFPPGNNYLTGVTVTFTCKPDYYLHGTPQRTCVNGSWSPGWWVWCRDRTEENVLKWFTGIVASLLIVAMFALIFIWCYCMRIREQKHFQTAIRMQRVRSRVPKLPGSPRSSMSYNSTVVVNGNGNGQSPPKINLESIPLNYEPKQIEGYKETSA